MRNFVLLVAFLSLSTAIGQSNNYVKPGGIGQPSPATSTNTCPTKDRAALPLNCWVGQKILFLPMSDDFQKYGYQSFRKNIESYPPSDFKYAELAGKIGIVTRVFPDSIGSPLVEVKLPDGTFAYGDTVSDQLDGIGFIRDLDSARKALVGKAVWLRGTGLATVDATGSKFGEVKTGRLAKVTITDIVAGTYGDSPIRIIAKTQDGRIGFEDIAWSNTNIPPILQDLYSFEHNFFMQNPRNLYNFPESQWKAIERGEIITGMSYDAAILAWNRKPDEINTTRSNGSVTEQWVYEGGKYSKTKYVYFTNGKVTGIQD